MEGGNALEYSSRAFRGGAPSDQRMEIAGKSSGAMKEPRRRRGLKPATAPFSIQSFGLKFAYVSEALQIPNQEEACMRGSKLMLQAAFVICACGALAFGQASSPNSRAKKTSSQKDNKTASATAPAAGKDSIVDSMDKSADPCVDFYQYACGGWRKKNPLPSDQSNYGRFAELAERNNLILKDILEKDAPNVSRSRSAVDQKIGDFYAACMDESAINKKGLDALKPELDGINGIKSKRDLEDVVISLHKEGTPGLFDYSSQQDFKNASKEIAAIDQGGMGLPSKEYYTKTDPKSVETREKYLEHVRKMLALSGYSPKQAVAGAKAVMNIETALAQGSLAPVERRDPQKIYHPTSVAD